MDRWKNISIYNDEIKFGDLLRRVEKEYKGKEKEYTRILLWWLRENFSLIYYPKKQTSYHRRLWYRASEILGLQHKTLEFSLNTYYCINHKKYCKYIKLSNCDKLYDSDHECSGNRK